SWQDLPEAVRAAHATGPGVTARGSFRIEHGRHPLARVLARLLRLPSPSLAADVHLRVTPRGDGEEWSREIGGQRLVSRQSPVEPNVLAERIRSIEFRFALDASASGLVYRQRGAALALGPLRVPLAARLAPSILATEEAVD